MYSEGILPYRSKNTLLKYEDFSKPTELATSDTVRNDLDSNPDFAFRSFTSLIRLAGVSPVVFLTTRVSCLSLRAAFSDRFNTPKFLLAIFNSICSIKSLIMGSLENSVSLSADR